MTTNQVVANNQVSVILGDKVYEVEELLEDEFSSTVFLKINEASLQPVDFQLIDDIRTFINKYVDITNYIDLKKRAIRFYHNEIRPAPHTRSSKNIIRLNALRGNFIGVEYSEAFFTVRNIS